MVMKSTRPIDFEPRKHFLALDSWRGICACLVVFLHVNAFSHAYFTPITRNAGLFVDFFFVLSGFVIAANYHARFQQGHSLGKFMFLRLGRLYPIHLVMLIAYITFEFAFADMISAVNANARQPFTGAMSLEAIWVNLFMLQGVGVLDYASWNFPSWSVSTELLAYFLFALGAIYLRKSLWAILALLVIIPPFWIYGMADGLLDNRFMGLARCLAGFSAGVLCLHAYRIAEHRLQRWSVAFATLMEACAVSWVLVYLNKAEGALTYALPIPFFFISVLVFANQRGLISRMLMVRPLVLIGTLSFSIYMIHAFVTARLLNAMQLAAGKLNLDIFTFYVKDDATQIRMVGKELWQGDLVYAAMLIAVIGASFFTYQFVEKPSRDWFRRIADRIWHKGLTSAQIADDYAKKQPATKMAAG